MTKATEIATLLARLAELIADSAPPKTEPTPVVIPAQRAMPERVLLTPEEAASRLGIGRTTMYSLIKTNEVISVQIGRSRRISVTALDEYAARLIARDSAA